MTIEQQIRQFIASQAEPIRADLLTLHELIHPLIPNVELWFLDGKNSENKTVSNPNIGYGTYYIPYANGTTKKFYQIGISPNKTGISVYLFGIANKNYLSDTFGKTLGKATVTGYCIKFKSLSHIDLHVLKEAILYGIQSSGTTSHK